MARLTNTLQVAVLAAYLVSGMAVRADDALKRAVADLESGRLEAAERVLADLSRLTPNAAEPWYHLGVARFRMGRLDAAAVALREAVRLSPESARAWKALGVVHAAAGRHDLADEPFRRACRLDAREPDACYYAARNAYSRNRFEDAIRGFEHSLNVDTQPWRVHNGLALALEAVGRDTEAAEHYRRAVALYRGEGRPDQHPRIDWGAFQYRQGKTEEASRELLIAVQQAPKSARARLELGRTLFKLGQLKEAASQLGTAVTLDPENWAAHILLGKVYHRMGRTADGDRHTAIGEKGLTRP